MQIRRSGNQICADFIDVSGAHGYHQITRLAILQKIIFNFFESIQAQAGMAQRFDLFGQCMGADPESVGLSGRVDLGQDDVIGQRERLREIIHKCLGPCVSVGLEHAVKLFVRIVGRSPECRLDLCRMMRVVINDCKAVSRAEHLKASLCSCVFLQRGGCVVTGNAETVRGSDGRHGVEHVVLAGNTEGDLLPFHAAVTLAGAERIGGIGQLVVADILRPVIGAAVGTVENDVARKTFRDLVIVGDLRVDDQRAVLRDELRKLPEGAADICKVLEEVKMICGGYRESLMSDGQLTPSTGMFWQKNYDGLRDATEHIVVPGDPLGEMRSKREIQEKYADIIME